jgi:hypothetical protein
LGADIVRDGGAKHGMDLELSEKIAVVTGASKGSASP